MLAKLYGHTYVYKQWPEHKIRIQETIKIVQSVVNALGEDVVVADMSCGDEAIVDGLDGVSLAITNDITHGDGGIEVTTKTMRSCDVFICSETIEHLEAPWTVLEQIAAKTQWIVLSTPLDESPEIDNYEHYWSFTEEDVNTLLHQAGFKDRKVQFLTQPKWTYAYQVWTAHV